MLGGDEASKGARGPDGVRAVCADGRTLGVCLTEVQN